MAALGAERKLGCEAVGFRFAPIAVIRRTADWRLKSTQFQPFSVPARTVAEGARFGPRPGSIGRCGVESGPLASAVSVGTFESMLALSRVASYSK
jgi:hypothetical protein